MIFGRVNKQRSALGVSLLGSLAFIALAIWGWDLPLEKAFSFFLISAILMMVIMIAAYFSAWLLSKLKGK